MDEFIKALFSKLLNTNAFSSEINGRVYPQVPTEEVFPYCLVTFSADGPQEMLGWQPSIETVHTIFAIYSSNNNNTEVLSLGMALQTLLNDCQLSITGYSFVRMFRKQMQLIPSPADRVIEYNVQYETWFYQ